MNNRRNTHTRSRRRSEQGVSLLYVVLMIVVMGFLLSSMVSMFFAANKTAVQVSNHREAYYMAESGLRYAVRKLNDYNYGPNLEYRLTRLNNIAFHTVSPSDDQKFNVQAFILGQLEAAGDQHASGGDEVKMRLPGDKLFDSNYTLPIQGTSDGDPYLVSAYDVDKPNEQHLVRVTATRVSADNRYLYMTVQDSLKVVDGEDMFLSVQVSNDAGGSQSVTQGASLLVEYAAGLFPPKNGIITIGEMEYIYTERVTNNNGTYTLTNLQVPNGGTWTADHSQNNLGNGDFVVLNSRNNKNVYFSVTGYAGVGDAQSVQATFALGDNVYLNDPVGPRPGTHPWYVLKIGGDDPTEYELYGNPADDAAYQGADAPEDVDLDSTNLADLDGNFDYDDQLIFAGRYGDNTVHDASAFPDVFYKDNDGLAGYEVGIRLDPDETTEVKSSVDYDWDSGDWHSFEVSYNVGRTAGYTDEAYIYVGTDPSAGYEVSIANPTLDPDHAAPLTFPVPSGKDRYISNFYIVAKGKVVNDSKYFYNYIRYVRVWVDFDDGNGLRPWPGDPWEQTSYDGTEGQESFVVDEVNGNVWRATTTGLSGSTEPTWPANPSFGDTVTDNEIIWSMGLPSFESDTDLASYLLSQFDYGAVAIKITGQFAHVWQNVNEAKQAPHGIRVHLVVHDVNEPTP